MRVPGGIRGIWGMSANDPKQTFGLVNSARQNDPGNAANADFEPIKGSSHGDQALPPASRGDLHAKRDKCEHRPATMEKHPRSNDHAARNRTNGGTFPKFSEGDQRRRMDGELTVVCNGLDDEDARRMCGEAAGQPRGRS